MKHKKSIFNWYEEEIKKETGVKLLRELKGQVKKQQQEFTGSIRWLKKMNYYFQQ